MPLTHTLAHPGTEGLLPTVIALHGYGSLYIAITFLVANGTRIPMNIGYAVPVALLAGVMVLRLMARKRVAKAA